MRRIPHRILLGAVLSVSLSTALNALPVRAFERATAFATCAGRLEALAVYGRRLSAFDSDEVSELSSSFSDMLGAVLPFALDEGVPPNQPAKWRAGGWSETALLLNERDYSFDASRAQRAAIRLQQSILDCTQLISPSEYPDWLKVLAKPTH